MFAAILAWGVALLALGAVRRGLGGHALCLLAGVVLGLSLFFSYGLVLAGLLPVAVALLSRRILPLITGGIGAAAVVAAFAAAGFWWYEGYEQVTVRYYQEGEYGLLRPYEYWAWGNLAALLLVLGPAVVAGLRRAAWRPRAVAARPAGPRRRGADRHRRRRPLGALEVRGRADLAALRGLDRAPRRPAAAPVGALVAARPGHPGARDQPPAADGLVARRSDAANELSRCFYAREVPVRVAGGQPTASRSGSVAKAAIPSAKRVRAR